MPSEFPSFGCVYQQVRDGDRAAAEQAVAELLERHPLDPAVSHFAGLYYFWRALDAERSQDADRAVACWEQMIPHLVLAMEDDDYLDRFRTAREESFAQPQGIPGGKITAAKADVYNLIDEQLQKLGQSYSQAELDEQRTRIQRMAGQWKLERLAAQRVRRLGGIPTGGVVPRSVVAGPLLARRYGFYEAAQEYIANFEVKERSPIDELMQMLSREKDPHGAEASPQVKREAGYCFSNLDLAFLHYTEKQFGRALDALTHLAETGGAGPP